MVAHPNLATLRRLLVRSAIVGVIAFPLLLMSCDKVPLLAPTGTVITLLSTTPSASLNSQVQIIATAIENGQASSAGSGATTTSRAGAGTPVQNGTVITFTTTIGQIQPSEARTHDGEVTVNLLTGGASGIATITAFSGGASASIELKVGTAAASHVSVSVTPQALGAAGGNAQVVAQVTDDGGSPIGGVPVTFSTDKGSISPSTVTTDGNGNATATLTTGATANITAAAGAQTGKAIVTVNARSLIGFSAAPSATSAGVPVVFTVTPATGANISNVHVDFGDGSSADLGAIGALTTTQHAYNTTGTFTATAAASDSTGGSGSLSTTVSIASLPVILSASPNPGTVGSPVTFTVAGVGLAQVDHYIWTSIDEGNATFQTSGPQLSHTFTARGIKNIQVDVFGVSGTKIGTARLAIDIT